MASGLRKLPTDDLASDPLQLLYCASQLIFVNPFKCLRYHKIGDRMHRELRQLARKVCLP